MSKSLPACVIHISELPLSAEALFGTHLIKTPNRAKTWEEHINKCNKREIDEAMKKEHEEWVRMRWRKASAKSFLGETYPLLDMLAYLINQDSDKQGWSVDAAEASDSDSIVDSDTESDASIDATGIQLNATMGDELNEMLETRSDSE